MVLEAKPLLGQVDCLVGLEKAAKTSAHMRHSGREGLELYSYDCIPLGGLLVSAEGDWARWAPGFFYTPRGPKAVLYFGTAV